MYKSRKSIIYVIVLGISIWMAGITAAGELTADEMNQQNDITSGNKPNIYFDCDYCDENFFKTELTFVNFVRDRLLADIHILITFRTTAAEGGEHTVELIGRRQFEGMRDTAVVFTTDSDTEATIRIRLLNKIKMGLMRFLLDYPLSDYLNIGYFPPMQKTENRDGWRKWVIKFSTDMSVNGEKTYRNIYWSGKLFVQKITKMDKIQFVLNGTYTEYKYDYSDYQYLSISRGRGLTSKFIKGLDDHWSAQIYNSVYSNSYSNIKMYFYLSPQIEYSLFPYSQSTNRLIRFIYGISLRNMDYEEETIYDKTSEFRTTEGFEIAVDLKKPWGSVYYSLNGSHYFFDFNKNHLQLYCELSLRIIQGLSLNVTSSYSRIHDQLSLAKGDASQEDILLRRRQLETRYEYYISFGISYSFGSIYSTIVNPRFGF